jgi:hypothetical protein
MIHCRSITIIHPRTTKTCKYTTEFADTKPEPKPNNNIKQKINTVQIQKKITSNNTAAALFCKKITTMIM